MRTAGPGGGDLPQTVYPYAVRELRRLVRQGGFDVPDVEVAVAGVMGGALAVMRRVLDGEFPRSADSA